MTQQSTAGGPELLDERSIGGVIVHLFALMTGFLGAGLVYLISGHKFTKANARNALNWHITLFLVTSLGLVLFFLGADNVTMAGETVEMATLLPSPVDSIAALVGGGLLVIAGIGSVLTLLFSLYATFKAIFGDAWSYPGSFNLVG
jgi:uncharacterized Tic20 family protein